MMIQKKRQLLGQFWVVPIDEWYGKLDVLEFRQTFELGLALAFVIEHKIVETSSEAETLIEEAYKAFKALLGLKDKDLMKFERIEEIPNLRP